MAERKCLFHGKTAAEHDVYLAYESWSDRHLAEKLFFCLDGKPPLLEDDGTGNSNVNLPPLVVFMDKYCLGCRKGDEKWEGDDWEVLRPFFDSVAINVLIISEDSLLEVLTAGQKQSLRLLEFERALENAKRYDGPSFLPLLIQKELSVDVKPEDSVLTKKQKHSAAAKFEGFCFPFPDAPHAVAAGEKKSIKKTMGAFFTNQGLQTHPFAFLLQVPTIKMRIGAAVTAKAEIRDEVPGSSALVIGRDGSLNRINLKTQRTKLLADEFGKNNYLLQGKTKLLRLPHDNDNSPAFLDPETMDELAEQEEAGDQTWDKTVYAAAVLPGTDTVFVVADEGEEGEVGLIQLDLTKGVNTWTVLQPSGWDSVSQLTPYKDGLLALGDEGVWLVKPDGSKDLHIPFDLTGYRVTSGAVLGDSLFVAYVEGDGGDEEEDDGGEGDEGDAGGEGDEAGGEGGDEDKKEADEGDDAGADEGDGDDEGGYEEDDGDEPEYLKDVAVWKLNLADPAEEPIALEPPAKRDWYGAQILVAQPTENRVVLFSQPVTSLDASGKATELYTIGDAEDWGYLNASFGALAIVHD